MPETLSYQERYWKELVQLKIQSGYLNQYHIRSVAIDRAIKMFLAVASSGSIAAWAVWRQFPYVWAAIIAIAQVVTAVKAYLPYQRRIEGIVGLGSDIAQTLIFAEEHWFDVSEGDLYDDDIHALTMQVRKDRILAQDTHFKENPLPRNEKCVAAATDEADTYFRTFYGEAIADA